MFRRRRATRRRGEMNDGINPGQSARKAVGLEPIAEYTKTLCEVYKRPPSARR